PDHEMDNHRLRTWLQLHLATDASAVTNLPFVLKSLTEDDFLSQAHVQKWTIRINSLIHSKDPGARWAGLSIALRTATLSRGIMNECAHGWITATLPTLFKNETLPCIKACIRLIRFIFSSNAGHAEFQRQVILPNIVKFSQALIEISGKYESEKLKVLCLETLAQLVLLFPSSHKQLHASLSTLTLEYLNGSSPAPSPKKLMTAASKLYAVLPCTGGKVGASNLWRKSVDETLDFTQGALSWLKADFQGVDSLMADNPPTQEDPMIYIPLNLDRLCAGITVLCYLLSSPTPRPVQVPMGQLSRLCITLLSCDATEQSGDYVDSSLIDMRGSTLPAIWEIAADLTECLLTRYAVYLLPNMSQILSCVAHHLERKRSPLHTLPFLRILVAACAHSRAMSNAILANRLVRAIIPYLTKPILPQLETRNVEVTDAGGSSKRKGKKRARGYEGDEVFKTNPGVLLAWPHEERVVMLSIEALRLLSRDTGISPEVYSVSSRLLLSLFLHLSRLPPSLISKDLTFHNKLSSKLQNVCIELASTKSAALGRALPLLMNLFEQSVNVPWDRAESSGILDILLHPKLPPLVRPLPPMENISLFRVEESEVERKLRIMLGLASSEDPEPVVSAQEPSREPESTAQVVETTHLPSSVPDPAPPILDSSNPPTKPPNDMQVDQTNTPPIIDAPQDQTPVKGVPSVLDPTPSTIRPNERPPLVSEPPQPPSWSHIGFVGDEDEEEDEEIPSINMESDSD
ncbi:hypothetical protein BDM02DRAFT_3100296, partial [Thelephora ganbajun]